MNNCCFNFPIPIFCPFIDFRECSNTVINPTLASDFAFLNNTIPSTIASQGIIPVYFVNMSGNSMIPSGNGGLSLTSGTYEVNYFVGTTIPASGNASIAMSLNSQQIDGSQIILSQTTGDLVNLTRTLVINVPNGGILTLNNASSDALNVSFASIFIRKL